MMLEGAKAIITGGSRGIGFAIARKFLEEGADVVITGRKMESLEEACRQLLPHRAIPMQWDAGDVKLCESNIAKAAELLGGLDILVNNAGVNHPRRETEDHFFAITEQEWDLIEGVNLKAVFFISRAAIIHMLAHNVKGHILNIGSEMAYHPAELTYYISKWGVTGLTQGLGRKFAPMGITVNGIAPGAVTTEMMNWHPGDSIERKSHPNGRFGLPEEIAELAAFLVSEHGRNIVGHMVISDGGSSLNRGNAWSV